MPRAVAPLGPGGAGAPSGPCPRKALRGVILKSILPGLTTIRNKMAPRPGKRLQDRGRNTPTKGLLCFKCVKCTRGRTLDVTVLLGGLMDSIRQRCAEWDILSDRAPGNGVVNTQNPVLPSVFLVRQFPDNAHFISKTLCWRSNLTAWPPKGFCDPRAFTTKRFQYILAASGCWFDDLVI